MSDHNSHQLGHILPFKIYRNVFIALLVLTFITVVLAKFVSFSPTTSIIIAMSIASVKATVVAMNFMHLKYENPITWMYALFPIFLLLLLIGGLFIDNPYRIYLKPDIEGVHAAGE